MHPNVSCLYLFSSKHQILCFWKLLSPVRWAAEYLNIRRRFGWHHYLFLFLFKRIYDISPFIVALLCPHIGIRESRLADSNISDSIWICRHLPHCLRCTPCEGGRVSQIWFASPRRFPDQIQPHYEFVRSNHISIHFQSSSWISWPRSTSLPFTPHLGSICHASWFALFF